MAITTYNVAPYHDDFNIKDAKGQTALDKNYLRILFQPGFAIQTREMNQMQSVLQAQIDRFGSSFYRDGQSVLDGEASFRDNIVYVEITKPTNVTLSDLTADLLLQPTIEIRTIGGITGGQYSKVLGVEAITEELVRVYLQSVTDISDSPGVSLNTLVPVGATLNYKEDKQYTSATATQDNTNSIATIASNGYGFSAAIEEGIFYVKGSFVHTPAIKRFWIKNSYSEIIRGDVNLTITENIVTSAQDETLLDNSTGSYNFSGPGADRYSISLDIGFFEEAQGVIRNIANQGANFYLKNSNQTFDIARLFTVNEETIESVESQESNNLEKKLAKRTFEESGNYTIRPFKVAVRDFSRIATGTETINGVVQNTYSTGPDPLYTESDLINQKPFGISTTTEGDKKVIFQLEPSTAYVNGFRYDFQDKVNLISDKARNLAHIRERTDVNLSLAQGNYIELELYDNPHYSPAGVNPRNQVKRDDFAFGVGVLDSSFSPTKKWTVDNIRAANINASDSYANSKIKTVQFVKNSSFLPLDSSGNKIMSATARNRVLNFDSSVGRTLSVNPHESPTAIYRVYLHNKTTYDDVLSAFPAFVNRKDFNDSESGYPLGNLPENEKTVIGTQAAKNAITVNSTSENTMLFRLPADAVRKVKSIKFTKYKKFTGTVGIEGAGSSDARTKIVLSDSGLESNEKFVGTSLTDKFDYIVTIKTTLPEVGEGSGTTASGGEVGPFERIVNPNTFVIDTVNSSATQIILKNISGEDHHFSFKFNDEFTVWAPVEVEGSIRSKLIKSGEVSQSAQSYPPGTIFELAHADVILDTIGGDGLPSESFEILDSGLDDPEFYRKPQIRLLSTVDMSEGGDNAKITYKYYKHQPGDVFCVNSYGDYTSSSTQSTLYGKIPSYRQQPLSEFLDFRVKETFNAEDNRTASGEPGPIMLVPNRPAVVDFDYYVGRLDRIIISDSGELQIVEGEPSEYPVLPKQPENSMTLYTYFMPPYTRDTKNITTKYVNNQRSTMKDITRLKERISAVEYYSSLSLLENDALQKNLINEDGSSRFKNGFVVDNFKQDKTANAKARDYLAATDKINGILRPYFHSNQFRLFYRFPAGNSVNRSSAANYLEKSTNVVEDYYVNSEDNQFRFDVNTQKSIPTTGRPQQINVRGFTVNTLNDNITNGIYTLYNPNTNGFPEYRLISGDIDLSLAPRRIVRVTSTAGITRWEVQSLNADKTGYQTTFYTDLLGNTGNDAPYPTKISGGWKNNNVEDMSLVTIKDVQADRITETLPESDSAKDVDRIVRDGQNSRDMLNLWNGSTETLFDQPNASRTLSVQPYEVTTYEGIVKLSPSGDEWVDTNRRPAQVIQDNSAMQVLTFLQNNTDVFEGVLGTEWNNWETISQGVESTTVERRRNWWWWNRRITDTIVQDQTREGVTTTLESNDTIDESQGDRVVNVNLVPFIRSRDVSIYCSGLKPNTRLYFFFDGKDVTRYVAATENFHEYSVHEQVTTYNEEGQPDSTKAGGPFQSTDENHYELPLFSTPETGEFFGTFRIPNNNEMRFRVGVKSFKVTSSKLDNDEDTDTIAETTYSAYGMNQTVEETITSTRVPELVRTQTSERRTRRIQRTRWRWRRRRDPVAQTFTIPERYGDGVCVTDIDIFFAEKPAWPVDAQVYLVPTEAGIPTNKVIPGSRISLPNSQVNVPPNGRDETDASKILPTNFKFEYPLYLKGGCEYAVIVFSPSTEYRVWVAELGRPNIMNANIPITTNSDIGVLLKSQNTKTWTPDQTKDLMFRLNKGVFKLNHTFEFHTKASGVTNNNQQGIGEYLVGVNQRNIEISSFNIASDFFNVPGTGISYNVNFESENGFLVKETYGLPTTILPKKTYELTKTINTYSLGVNDIIVQATLTGKDRGDGFSDITPMLDLDKHSLLTFNNVLSQTPKAYATQNSVHINVARDALPGFVTKNIKLINPADQLKIFMKTNRLSAGGNIQLYAKVRGLSDDCPWDKKLWEPVSVADTGGISLADAGGYSPSIAINGNLEDFSESEFNFDASSNSDQNEIIEYALKIGFVNNGGDSSSAVKIKDLRIIATS
jgi:hypothetical protein